MNFRYGRRNANLREGTKTVFPVAYDEAIKIHDKLIDSKRKKGYTEEGETVASVPEPDKILADIRAETIIKYLQQAQEGTYARPWKISKIILRATQLRIETAISSIAPFVRSEDPFEKYAAIYALLQFGNIDKIKEVQTVFSKKKNSRLLGVA